MSRHSSTPAYGQRITKVSYDHYRLSWVVDRYYASSRLRHPTAYRRDTDKEGAKRFAAKWGLKFAFDDEAAPQ